MGTVASKFFGGVGEYEATAMIQPLRACAGCGEPHPLARRPAQPADRCPDCGAPTAQLETANVVEAAIILPWPLMMVARLFGQIGAWLNELGRKVDDP